ncbi:MAG TPA: DUF1259 domain-containing protein [Gemmatimonadales bacterium]|jgi:hypothetical protein
MYARLPLIALILSAPVLDAQTPLGAPWDSVGKILKTTGTMTGGYYRFGWPRRDITLMIGDVTVAPALALGAWAGFAGDSGNSTVMGDLVLAPDEVKATLAELATQRIDVSAIHNHVVGDPQVTYVHFHAEGRPLDLAARVDRVLARTKTPRPVTAPAPQPVTIDTATVFGTLGLRGRAQGNVVQLSTVLVPGAVTVRGRTLNPAQAYGTPINIQVIAGGRAVATGDFSITGDKVGPVFGALTAHGITATALHSHLVGEEPKIYYMHFWADGPLPEVLGGLRAALDAARASP